MSYPQYPNMPPMPPHGTIDPNRRKKMALYGVLTGVGLIVAVLLGLKMAGILQFRAASDQNNSLQAHGATGNSSLMAQGRTGNPSLQSTGPAQRDMPPDVREWLEHLKKTEEKRADLNASQLSVAKVSYTLINGTGDIEQVKGLLDEINGGNGSTRTSVDRVKEELESMNKGWEDLSKFFMSKTAPVECVPIQQKYNQMLLDTGGMMSDISEIMKNISEDPTSALTKLEKMKNTSKDKIDKPATESDRLVQDICDKYDVKKWFKIHPDFGGGTLSGGL